MVSENADDVRDDDSSSEGGFTVSREDCEAILREYEESLPEMPDEDRPQTLEDVLNTLGSHGPRPTGYRNPGTIEVEFDKPDGGEGQGDTSDE